jgi:hypothetical protein
VVTVQVQRRLELHYTSTTKAFAKFDQDGTGYLTLQQITEALSNLPNMEGTVSRSLSLSLSLSLFLYLLLVSNDAADQCVDRLFFVLFLLSPFFLLSFSLLSPFLDRKSVV